MLVHQIVYTAVVVVLLGGVSIPFWTIIGIIRTVHRPQRAELGTSGVPALSQVAILIAAHNEEFVIAATLQSATQQLAPEQVFVASDGSTDLTSAIARSYGVNVLDVQPNRGKAGALAAAIDHFELADRFEVVMLLDADTKLADDYMATGLPLFADSAVVAVAGTAATNRHPAPRHIVGRLLLAYRERVYIVFQYLQKFGQAAKAANVVTIVPGFASMYRTRVLSAIDITAPGLAIEDVNMTFELHAKNLGRIEFRPGSALAYTQDPTVFADYCKQVGRWSLGFWQTVKRHRVRPNRFWVSVIVSVIELVVGDLSALLVIPAVLVSTVAAYLVALRIDPGFGIAVSSILPAPLLIAGALLPDFAMTIVAAIISRRIGFLLFGLAFPILRIIDAAIGLHRLGVALFSTSSGIWVSPARRAITVPGAEPMPDPIESILRCVLCGDIDDELVPEHW